MAVPVRISAWPLMVPVMPFWSEKTSSSSPSKSMITTSAASRWVSSESVTVRPLSIGVAAACSVYGVSPALRVTSGGSLLGATVTSRDSGALVSAPASVTAKVTVRVAVDGVSAVFRR